VSVSNLQILGLRVNVGNQPVLVEVSLEMLPHEYLVVVGKSGAGKTTFLRTLAGLQEAEGGQILVEGHDLTQLNPGDRGVSLVFQSDALYPHLTVTENVELPLRLRKVHRRDRAAQAERLMDRLGLGHLANRSPQTLSGGERQRVALARALVSQPRLLLLDEPMANLDLPARAGFRQWLKSIPSELDCRIVHVTHDQYEALALGDRVALLAEGRLLQVATPRHIYDQPDHVQVAEFFGWPPMNWLVTEKTLLHGKYASQSMPKPGLVRVTTEEAFLWIRKLVPDPNDVLGGIRPEDVMCSLPLDEPTTQPSWRGVVQQVEYAGHEQHATLSVDGGILHSRWPRDVRWAIGQTVQVGFSPERIQWFNSRTNRRMQ